MDTGDSWTLGLVDTGDSGDGGFRQWGTRGHGGFVDTGDSGVPRPGRVSMGRGTMSTSGPYVPSKRRDTYGESEVTSRGGVKEVRLSGPPKSTQRSLLSQTDATPGTTTDTSTSGRRTLVGVP